MVIGKLAPILHCPDLYRMPKRNPEQPHSAYAELTCAVPKRGCCC